MEGRISKRGPCYLSVRFPAWWSVVVLAGFAKGIRVYSLFLPVEVETEALQPLHASDGSCQQVYRLVRQVGLVPVQVDLVDPPGQVEVQVDELRETAQRVREIRRAYLADVVLVAETACARGGRVVR